MPQPQPVVLALSVSERPVAEISTYFAKPPYPEQPVELSPRHRSSGEPAVDELGRSPKVRNPAMRTKLLLYGLDCVLR
jgi:hypothetical protein